MGLLNLKLNLIFLILQLVLYFTAKLPTKFKHILCVSQEAHGTLFGEVSLSIHITSIHFNTSTSSQIVKPILLLLILLVHHLKAFSSKSIYLVFHSTQLWPFSFFTHLSHCSSLLFPPAFHHFILASFHPIYHPHPSLQPIFNTLKVIEVNIT